MKLFLHPKNIIGNAKKTESKKQQLMKKKIIGSTVSQGNELRKLACTSSWFIVCTSRYPNMPTSRQDMEQTNSPTSVAHVILLSFALRIPLKTGQKFIWKASARIRLGMEAIASYQSVGNVFISNGTSGGTQSFQAIAQCTKKVNTKIKIPVTPINAINLRFSIFLTMIEGISQMAMSRAIAHSLVQNQFIAECSLPITSPMILRMLTLKMMIQMIQMPILLKKIKNDPKLLLNLF